MADDLFRKLESGFRSIGKGVRSGAKELQQAAGIGVGKLELSLDRFDFRPGDSIVGTVRLALTEPMEAKRLIVSVVGTRERVGYEKDSAGHKRQTRDTEILWEFERELAGARTYRDQEYRFDIAIPSDVHRQAVIQSSGIIGDIARVVQSATSSGRMPARWRVLAELDIPWKRNIKHKVDITVRE